MLNVILVGLRHFISRGNVTSLTPRESYHRRSKSYDSINQKRVKRLLGGRTETSPKVQKNKEKVVKPKDSSPVPLHSSSALLRSSLQGRPGFKPSIGSGQGSESSLVSSTVDTAAHLARSSIHSLKGDGIFGIPALKVEYNNYGCTVTKIMIIIIILP